MEIEQDSKCNGFTTKEGNYVWGGALGLAWNELVQNIIKQKILIESKDFLVLKLAQNFNSSRFSKQDIDESCVYVKSGYGQKTIDEINEKVREKFPRKSFQNLQYQLGEQEIISYAYLVKRLDFFINFERNKLNNFVFQNRIAQSFYAKNKAQKEQIRWYYYKSRDQFMINIISKNRNDQLYLIKDFEINSVDQAIEKVMNFENGQQRQLGSSDQFEMPVIELDVQRNFKQLQGETIANWDFYGHKFSVVYEAIKLKIDETGAHVENQASIVLLSLTCASESKQFILDKRFWVVMKEKNKHPYLCTFIKNPIEKQKQSTLI